MGEWIISYLLIFIFLSQTGADGTNEYDGSGLQNCSKIPCNNSSDEIRDSLHYDLAVCTFKKSTNAKGKLCYNINSDPTKWLLEEGDNYITWSILQFQSHENLDRKIICSDNSSPPCCEVNDQLRNQSNSKACCIGKHFLYADSKKTSNYQQGNHDCHLSLWKNELLNLFWVSGVVALVGNAIVAIHSAWKLKRKKFRLSRVQKHHCIMILSLSVADFLMAVYLLGLAVLEGLFHGEEYSRIYGMDGCTAISIINFISSQVSVTTLVIITAVRMYSVTFPYGKVNAKILVTVIAVTWVVWITLAFLPSLNLDLIRSTFMSRMYINRTNLELSYNDLFGLVNATLTGLNMMCNLTEESGYYFPERRSWQSLFELSQKLTLIDSNSADDIIYGGFYSWDFCALNLLVSPLHPYMFYTMFVIMYNLLSFIFIFISQIIICRKSSTDITVQVLLSNCCIKSKENRQIHTHRRELENYKMHRRMFFIVLTDFFCWIPLLTISLYYFILSNFEGSDELLENIDCWFPTLLIVLLPINSAINPFLYSSHVWGIVWDKIKGCFNKPQDGVQGEATEMTFLQTSAFHVDRCALDLTQNEDS